MLAGKTSSVFHHRGLKTTARREGHGRGGEHTQVAKATALLDQLNARAGLSREEETDEGEEEGGSESTEENRRGGDSDKDESGEEETVAGSTAAGKARTGTHKREPRKARERGGACARAKASNMLSNKQRATLRKAVTEAIDKASRGGSASTEVVKKTMSTMSRLRGRQFKGWNVNQYYRHQSDMMWAVVAEAQLGLNGVAKREDWVAERVEGGKYTEPKPMWREESMKKSGYDASVMYEPLAQTAQRALRMMTRWKQTHDDPEVVEEELSNGRVEMKPERIAHLRSNMSCVGRGGTGGGSTGGADMMRACLLWLMKEEEVCGQLGWMDGEGWAERAMAEAVRRQEISEKKANEILRWWTVDARSDEECGGGGWKSGRTQMEGGTEGEGPPRPTQGRRRVFLEVFAGCASGKRAARARSMRHVGVDIMPAFFDGAKRVTTTVVMDLLKIPGEKWIEEICKMARVDMDDVEVVWMSPPCNTFSRTDACNKSEKGEGKHCAFRDHSTEERHPVDWRTAGKDCEADLGDWGRGGWNGRRTTTYYGDMARRGDRLAKQAIAAVRAMRGTVIWIIENPVGSLQRRPYMASVAKWIHDVHYCVYGGYTWKHTNIWTNNVKWVPKGTRGGDGEGRCSARGRCEAGRQGKRAQDWKHDLGIAGAGESGIKGKGKKAKQNAVPVELIEEILC